MVSLARVAPAILRIWVGLPAIRHRRDRNGAEVDLHVEDDSGRIALVEVKAASTIATGDVKHLQALRDKLGDRTARRYRALPRRPGSARRPHVGAPGSGALGRLIKTRTSAITRQIDESFEDELVLQERCLTLVTCRCGNEW